jgi:hypothetical protein
MDLLEGAVKTVGEFQIPNSSAVPQLGTVKKRLGYVGILIAVVAFAFMFAPIIPWRTPVNVDAYFTAQVSPSYYLFRCGVAYNVATVYTENGQVILDSQGAQWTCLHPRL